MAFKILSVAKSLLKNDQFIGLNQALVIRRAHTFNMYKNEKDRVGSREYVGYGWNGEAAYLDRFDFPFPSIRFRPCTPEIMALREKERGDWRKLTIDEKKSLYRASFCQTFAEMNAPTGEIYEIIGWILFWISVSLWVSIFAKTFIYNKAPSSFSRESRIEQYYRMVAMNACPIKRPYRPPGAEYREFKYNPLNKNYPD